MFKIIYTVILVIQAVISSYYVMAFRYKKVGVGVYIAALLGIFFSMFFLATIWR